MTENASHANDAPEFSAVISCYFEEKSIDEFHARLSAAFEALGRPYELLFVNDGSTDGTWEKLKAIYARDPHVYGIIDFFKNAGQQAAVTAAICEARGRAFVLMDSDLQLDPAELPLLVAEYDQGCDLVTGYRKNRKDSLFRVVPSKIANMIMRAASHSTIRDFGCTFKIYNGALIRAFHLGPRHIFSNVDLIAKLNRCAEVPITHYPRRYGKSGWTFRKLWQYNMENIMKLSQRPFQVLAGLCMLTSIVFVLRIFLGFAFDFRVMDQVSNGLLLNVLVVALLVLLAVLSVLGEFTVRSFVLLQRAPLYAIREKHLRNEGAPKP
jgi:glycosyltransferase involved in cell wall biosynthesis